MSYLSKEYIQFFKDLAPNNHSEWFNENRKRYETFVKEPFQKLVGELIGQISSLDKNMAGLKTSDCIFRINRDIRFSKDKTPYKMQMGAAIAPGGKKNMTYPGFYFEASAEGINVYGGVYMAEKQQLESIRKHIAKNLKTFNSLISAPAFMEKFGGKILGEKQSRIAPELKEAAAVQPLLYNKQFYFMGSMDESYITRDDLPEVLLSYFKAGRPVGAFLSDAL